ncbi:RHS repeat-associated core domain-containing protein [Psychroserpens sp. MEBiC05023]
MKKLILLYIFILPIISYSQNDNTTYEEDKFTYEREKILESSEGNILLTGGNKTIRKSSNSSANRSGTGVGETLGQLSVSLSGAAQYNIPIAVPSGITGIAPEISLSYDSQGGNGIAGYGWNLSGISSISRIPSSKYHDDNIDEVDFNSLDRFALDGERLIFKSGVSYGAHRAKYETEHFSNIKIVSVGTSPYGASYGPKYFNVFYPDGSFAQYGNSTDSRSQTEYAITYWENPQGVRISYEYTTFENSLSIDKIKYGGLNTSNQINEVRFIYDNSGSIRSRWEQSYVGNVSIARKNILTRIESFSNNVRFRRYNLYHDTTDLEYNRLTGVTEYSGDLSQSHSSVTFNYTDTTPSVGYQEIVTSLGLANIEQRNSQMASLDLTGNGSMDFVIYPNDKSKFWLFKDLQPGSSNAPYTVNSGTFEAIFPTKLINYNDVVFPGQGLTVVQNGSGAQVNFKVYANGIINPITLQYTKTWNSSVYVNDVDCSFWNNINVPKEYVSGDFNGDGLTDVLAIQIPYQKQDCNYESCDKFELPDGPGGTCCHCSTSTVYAKGVSFIDLRQDLTTNFAFNAGSLDLSVGEDDVLTTGDFNGDGKTDLFHVKEDKIKIYTLTSSNSIILLEEVNDTGISPNEPPLFGDYNGDGKTDFIDPISNNNYTFKVFISTGTEYESNLEIQPFKFRKTNFEALPFGIDGILDSYNLIPLDVNGDGRTDIVEYNTVTSNNTNNGTQTIKVYNNDGIKNNISSTGVRFSYVGTATKTGNLDHYPIPIFLTSTQPNKSLDFASISDQWVTHFTFTQDHREDVLMRSVTNNGVTYNIDYSNLNPDEENNSFVPVYESSNSMTYPYSNINYAPGIKLVKMLERVTSGATTLQQQYRYRGAIFNYEGLGFQGFEGVAISNWHTNNMDRIYNVSIFDPVSRGIMSASYSQENFVIFDPIPTSGYIDKTTYVNSSSISTSKVFKSWVDSSLYQNSLEGTSINSTYTYDSYLNTTGITTQYTGAGFVITTNEYSNNIVSSYHVGRLTKQTITSSITNNTFNTEVQFIYTDNLVTEKKIKGNGTNFDSETYEYDTFGNVTKKTITPYNESSRFVEFEYDTSGRFLEKTIDLEGLETIYVNNPNTGTLSSETDPYGNSTSYDYDSWLRLTKVTDYLGNESTMSFSEDSNNIYTVTSVSDDGSSSITIYDRLKRVSQVKEKDIMGQWVNKSFEYDKFDRLWKESEPYIGSNATQWNEILYDKYSRPVTQNLYTGRTITMSYNGLTTTVNDGVKVVSSIRDAMGNTKSVTDPGGTINYTYYGNGNLKTANNNGVIVSLEQDGWGRKTKLSDPSAGVYEYEYNGFGELTRQVNPKGEVEYDYSNFGKLLEKEITGDNTEVQFQYSYDATSKLLDKITTTNVDGNNGIIDYNYDTNKRLNNVIETNPYAKFEKDYTYDNFGRIETEEYKATLLSNSKTSNKKIKNIYQNGGVKAIQDFTSNAVLWELTGVNARGQMTSASMGNNMLENKTYDNYGYLTNNTVFKNTGQQSVVLMQLANDFDVQRGILNSRTSSLFSWSETFGYDNLDRLITFNDNDGNNSLSYDTFGRITSDNTIGDYNYSGTSYQISNVDLNHTGDLYYQQNELQQVSYNAFKKPFEINEEGKEKIGFQYNAFNGRSHMFYGDTESDILDRNNRKHYSFDGSMEISYDDDANTSTFVTYIAGDAYSAPVIWRSNQVGSNTDDDYYYIERDYLGSILLISDEDGNPMEKRHFDAWGNIVRVVDGNNVTLDKLTFLDRGYTGHEHLDGVKLIHMNGRLYDPKLKRFLSPDNYIQDISNTQNFNRYGYVLNNPLMYVDPSGETTETPGGGSGGQVAAGSLAGSLYNSLSGVDFRPAREWIGRNARSIVRDASNLVREIGRGIKELFGGGDRITYMDNPINQNNDPLTGSSSNMQSSFFGSSGSEGNLGLSMFKNHLSWLGDKFNTFAQFSMGASHGFAAGGKSTWDFVKSLGTINGWLELGAGALRSSAMVNPFSDYGAGLRSDMANSVVGYIQSIPSMSAYEAGYQVGYVTEKVAETIIVSKGVGLLANTVFKASRVTMYRNFGWNELKSIKSAEGKFSIHPRHFQGKQFWVGESGLEMWSQKSSFVKPFTARVTIPKSYVTPGHRNYIFMENNMIIDGHPGGTVLPANLKKFNSVITIDWIRF